MSKNSIKKTENELKFTLVNGVITSVIIAVLQSVITDISLIMNIVKKF